MLNDLCRRVFPHAFAEEAVLWPALRRRLADGEQLTLEVEKEHQAINELFTSLKKLDVDSPEHHRLFDEIVHLLREDVRDEEDVLLPRLQQACTREDLIRLGTYWQAVRSTAPTRPHPVVARRPPGNALSALPSPSSTGRETCSTRRHAPKDAGLLRPAGRAGSSRPSPEPSSTYLP